ncbi:MAG: hypothetical protein ACK4VK_00285 [Aquificaceae bacterium]
MNLKLALSNGRILKVKTEFPYNRSPIGYRALLKGQTAIVVGLEMEGEEIELQFPDQKPITTEKHIASLLDTAKYYSLFTWRLLFDLLPSVFNWREEEFIILGEKKANFLDKLSLQVLEYVKKRRQIKEENLKEKFGKDLVEKLIQLGFLKSIREWVMPPLEIKVYYLTVSIEEALHRLKRFKKKEEKIRLLHYVFERRKATEEELKEAGFRSADLGALVEKGILEEREEIIEEVRYVPRVRQEKKEYLKPLGKRSILFGHWEKTKDFLIEEVDKHISQNKSVFIFCNTINLSNTLYQDLYPIFGDRLVFITSSVKPKEFIRRWFYLASADGVVLLGSKVSLLAPIKDLSLLAYVEDGYSKDFEGFDIKYFLYSLCKYYGANFLFLSSLPPLSLCLKQDWQRIYQEPDSEVLILKRKAQEILSPQAKEIIRENLQEEWLFLVNKSGYAYAYCGYCGWILECPRCGSFLTLNKDKSLVFCSSCGYKAPAICQECGKQAQELGFGIEKAVEEIGNLFGNRENFHFDTTPRLGRSYENVMVLHGDNILSVPWFDSEERYFSYLWTALCISKKRLVVQSLLDKNPILHLLEKKDWQAFCQEELERRKEEELPPFKRLILVKLRKLPSLEGLSVELKKKKLKDMWELFIKVDKRHLTQLLKLLREYEPISLQVV